MVAPFLVGPRAVSLFIYHQGEADSTNGQAYYNCHLQALIADWRASFGPPASVAWFGVTQLAPWGGNANSTSYSLGVAGVRAAQFNASLALPNVTVAVIVDDGDPLAPAGSVHSRRKQLVAQRLVNGALRTQFNKTSLQILGPTYMASEDATTDPTGQTISAVVSFQPETCGDGGVRFVYGLNDTSLCPTDEGIAVNVCAWFAVQSAKSGAWANATSVAVVNATAVRLTAPGSGVAGDTSAATSFGWGAYPVVTLFSNGGGTGINLPVTPWNVSVGGVM
jgi:hypothetical protein